MSIANAQLAPAVYTQDMHWDSDPQRSFIFSNKETLKKIRWRFFLSDCTPLMVDYHVVEKLREQEISAAKSFLDENYHDILENFDPKVIKLRKKRKVIMSSGVLGDLEKLNDEE